MEEVWLERAVLRRDDDVGDWRWEGDYGEVLKSYVMKM